MLINLKIGSLRSPLLRNHMAHFSGKEIVDERIYTIENVPNFNDVIERKTEKLTN